MLRIEQGFDPTLFASDDPDTLGYVEHHRLLVPSIVAYDMYGNKNEAPSDKLQKVRSGTVRSATLAMQLENLELAPQSDSWQEICDEIAIGMNNSTRLGNWTYNRAVNDQHTLYRSMSIWTSKRDIAWDDDGTVVRERYSIAAPDAHDKESIAAVFESDVVFDDLMIATATVYALNKSVAKPGIVYEETDWSQYPVLAAIMNK